MRWHPETLACAFRGHIVPALTIRRLGPKDSGLGVDLADGRRVARCLRCDAWVAGRPRSFSGDVLPPLDELAVPARGRALRDRIVLRLIALDRGIHAVLFTLLFVVVLLIDLHLGSLRGQAEQLMRALRAGFSGTGADPSRRLVGRVLADVARLRLGTLHVLLATSAVYAVLEGAEAAGLWLQRRWAEYLTAVATAGFLPFEIYELAKRVTVLRVTALVVNVAILVYLVWAKRLFGIRGGVEPPAFDRAEIFAPGSTGESIIERR